MFQNERFSAEAVSFYGEPRHYCLPARKITEAGFTVQRRMLTR